MPRVPLSTSHALQQQLLLLLCTAAAVGGAVLSCTVTTIAGTSSFAPITDGAGTVARLNQPAQLSLDPSGSAFFLAGRNDMRVRRVTTAGVVTSIAGGVSGTNGFFADGTGTNAGFNTPAGIATDVMTNVSYVSDTVNHRIRTVWPNGTVATLSGLGTAGWADGAATSCRFNFPWHIALDLSRTLLYVADSAGARIRTVVIATGAASTLAGGAGSSFPYNGLGSVAAFNLPRGIAVDALGTIVVGDFGFNLIRQVTPEGLVSTLAGCVTAAWLDGVGTNACFAGPIGVTLDAGSNIYGACATRAKHNLCG